MHSIYACQRWRKRLTCTRTHWYQQKPNSIKLSWSQTGSKLVADLQRAGIWPM